MHSLKVMYIKNNIRAAHNYIIKKYLETDYGRFHVFLRF